MKVRIRLAIVAVLLLICTPAGADNAWFIYGLAGGAKAPIPNNDIVTRDLLSADQLASNGTNVVYATDSIYERILRVDLIANSHTTVSAARPIKPRGIAFDGSGSLVVAEPCEISRMDSSGVLTRIAGTGTCGYSGDGISATSSMVNGPTDLVWLSPNLYFVDTLNYRIRYLDSSGVLRNYAGSGTAGNSPDTTGALVANILPTALAIDALGYMFVASGPAIRAIDPYDGKIYTAAGSFNESGYLDGTAILARFGTLKSFSLMNNNLYITDTGNRRVRKFSTALSVVSTIAGNGNEEPVPNNFEYTALTYALGKLSGIVALDTGTGTPFIYFGAHQRMYGMLDTPANTMQPIVGTGIGLSCCLDDGFAPSQIHLNAPQSVAGFEVSTTVVENSISTTTVTTTVYIADTQHHRVVRVRTVCCGPGGSSSSVATTIAGRGEPGVATDGVAATSSYLREPTAVAVDAQGLVYIADTKHNRVRRVGSDGIITTVAGNGGEGVATEGALATQTPVFEPNALTFGPNGDLFVTSYRAHLVYKVQSSDGKIYRVAGKLSSDTERAVPCPCPDGPALQAVLDRPGGLAASTDFLFVSDLGHHVVRSMRFANGEMTTYAGNGQSGATAFPSGDGTAATLAIVRYPRALIYRDRRLFISESGWHRIRSVDDAQLTPLISTIAGTGNESCTSSGCGDGGEALQASLRGPYGIGMIRGSNNRSLYIADTGRWVVRKLN